MKNRVNGNKIEGEMHTLIPIAVDKRKKETEFFAERERNKDES